MAEHTDGLDEMDLKILSFLQDDGRMTFKEIASRIGVAERTIRLRVSNLRENGTLSIVGVVSPMKIGLNVIAAIQIAAAPDQLEQCAKELAELDEVRFVALITGEYQILSEVCVESNEALSDLVEQKLKKVAGIERMNVIVELKVLKNKFNFIREN
ncbi:Lrp/AsnC family transcriptional regulator [Planomicrobium chinense]|uniref:Lrp/AsnC family transcriptional regulator n=1 Tax=Planococcus chinensis TaxID=272917 RepID=UPI001CC4B40F|nr:Lrp/AsnC family transcriptional regulator [Planococcus chinensis]MBZ5200575.1 Lrp/AsnC family transcriptional regulator [Planococcus chinensis]